MSGRLLRLRSRRWQEREWPRSREGAAKDERRWIRGLEDRELARLAAALGRIDRVVEEPRGRPGKDAT